MPSNIEIKARVADLEELEQKVTALAPSSKTDLTQEDVFFNAPRGRLKLRIFSENAGELIAYDRPDTAGAKQSTYQISPTATPAALRTALAAALGEWIVVRKERRVYIVGQTRVHLDRVQGLGDFMELEVVLRGNQTPGEGQAIAGDLMQKLGIAPADLVSVAYADLLAQSQPNWKEQPKIK